MIWFLKFCICSFVVIFSVKGLIVPKPRFALSNFECVSTKIDCNGMKKNVDDVLKTLTQAIDLKESVLIDVKLTKLNDDIVAKGFSFTYIKGYFQGEDIKNWVYFPQGLAKQYGVQFPKNTPDCVVEINDDIDWFFDGVTKRIESIQRDFKATLMHEILHCLGFSSSVYNPTGTKFAVPQIGPTIFDKYLFTATNESIYKLLNSIANEAEFPNDEPYSVYKYFYQLSPRAVSDSQKLYKYSTQKTPIYFVGNHGKYGLYTKQDDFINGRTLDHICEQCMKDSSTDIMQYMFKPGKLVKEIIDYTPSWKYEFLTPGILDVLKKLGWDEKMYSNKIVTIN